MLIHEVVRDHPAYADVITYSDPRSVADRYGFGLGDAIGAQQVVSTFGQRA